MQHQFHFRCFARDTSLLNYYWYYTAGTPMDISAYLDDFLAATGNHTNLCEWVSLTRCVFNVLGCEFKERKCEWEPTELKRHLGVLINTQRCLFFFPSEKEQKSKEMAVLLLSGSRVAAGFWHASVVWRFPSTWPFRCPKFSLQSLYTMLHTKRNWRGQLTLSLQAYLNLQAW